MSAAVAYLDRTGGGGNRIARRLVGFIRVLRDNGFLVGSRETIDAVALASTATIAEPSALRQSFRTLLCGSPLDWRRFEDIFDLYWRGHGTKARTELSKSAADQSAPALSDGSEDNGRPGSAFASESEIDGVGAPGTQGGASDAETLGRRDLRDIADPDELKRLYDLTERLAARMKYRLTRRDRARRRGHRLDVRKVIHKSVRFGGTPLRLAYRQRRPKPLRLVVILDASGSMSLYSAFFVRFLRGIVDKFREAEAFVFHTRLVHISEPMRERDMEKALERMALMVSGWDGGTKIGECLASFNDNHAKRTINTRTAVIIISDGYDTGPPSLLAAQMARLKRRARRIVWLNPMIGWQDYEPVASGMAAAMPYIDLFAPAHNLESLAALEPYLVKL